MTEKPEVPFDLNELIEELKIASQSATPKPDVKAIMDRVFDDPNTIRQHIPHFEEDEINLYEDNVISIWVCRFMPGTPIPPHDHQMSAMIGLYAGIERNRFFKLETKDKIVETGHVDMKPGDVLNIAPTAIHAVECVGNEPSCGIHVYFGPLQTIDRSLYDQRAGTRLKFTESAFNRLTEQLKDAG